MVSKYLFIVVLVVFSTYVNANSLNRKINDLDKADEENILTIPYAFYNESIELAAAVAITASGYIQPQTAIVLNAFQSTNSTSNLFFAMVDYQTPFLERLFVDGQFMYADWGETESYQSGNPDFPDEVAGGNGSDKDNYILAEGSDIHTRLKFKYLLPIGHGAGNPVHTFATQDGLLVEGYEAGGDTWNPLTSGRTTLEIEPFYREQDFDDEFNNNFSNVTSGAKFTARYDNTDWYNNPSYGSNQHLSVARDWGLNDDSPTFTSVQFSYSKYIPLPLAGNFRQRTLALNFWTSDVPTWNSSHTDKSTGEEIYHRAPLFEGSALGGIDRQRGFSSDRYHDRAAINYSAEYRVTPHQNLATKIPLINKLPIPWWQWIGFIEVGRVAGSYSISELHKDMKVSLGAGFRVMVDNLVIRVDAAGSEEGGQVQMFFSHTY
jgi:hypothetical protein